MKFLGHKTCVCYFSVQQSQHILLFCVREICENDLQRSYKTKEKSCQVQPEEKWLIKGTYRQKYALGVSWATGRRGNLHDPTSRQTCFYSLPTGEHSAGSHIS